MPLNKNTFFIKRNDTLPSLSINIIDRGRLTQKQAYNLSGVTGVTFSMMNQNCDFLKISAKPAQITCYSGGSIQYNWDSEDTNESGIFLGEFELSYYDGKKMSLPSIGGIMIEINDDIGMG